MMRKRESDTSSGAHNLIAPGTKIIGQIIAEDNLRIDGAVEGKITCKGKVVLGPSCLITGDIECANLELMGKIDGNIVCSENLTLKNTSRLTGNIKTRTLEIELGAVFNGECSINSGQGKLGKQE